MDILDLYNSAAGQTVGEENMETSVLVVGGGVIGLSMAIMLAKQGIDVTVCELRDEKGTSRLNPFLLQTRTMEIYRSLGLADAIKKESARWYDQRGGILALDTLTSSQPIATYSPSLNDRIKDISPSSRVFLTQHLLMRILRARAKTLPLIKLRYACGVVDLKQTADEVIAKTTSGEIRAKYCVSCDGTSSTLRKGDQEEEAKRSPYLAKSLTIVFRANLKNYFNPAYSNALIYVSNSRLRGLVRLDKTGSSGILVVYKSIRRIPAFETAPPETARQILHDAIGREDVYVELKGGEDWYARHEEVDNLQDGRIFLAGDAARQMAPTGGFAGNAGIQDAHNLAWKLAFVLRSQAEPPLLDTYHTERHPVGIFTMEQAYKRWKIRCFLTQTENEEQEKELPDAYVDLGHRYNNSDAVMYINGAKGAVYEDPFWPTAFPGSRAPHVWTRNDDMREGGKSKSLYDSFDPAKFTLLCSEYGQKWVDAAENLSKVYPLKVSLMALESDFLSKYKIQNSGAVIVRPDGVIGWKALNDSEVGLLEVMLKRLLCFEVDEDEVPPLPTLSSRSATVPEVGGLMRKMTLSASARKSPPRTTIKNTSEGGGGLLRRMTTMRPKKKTTA